MSQQNKLHLKSSCIFNVPFQTYEQDFTFIVNGKEFRTSRLISDLLSPKICNMHSNDPLFDTYIINTEHQGDFQQILKLIDFKQETIQIEDLEFVLEVIESLGNDSFEITRTMDMIELTIDNVFSLIQKHKKFPKFYTTQICREIEFISSHFHEIVRTHSDEMGNLSIDTLKRVLNNDKLKLIDEDQLLNFVNKIYENDRRYVDIYETVIFTNVSANGMKEFVSVFDYNDLNSGTWNSIASRLQEETVTKEPNMDSNRYYNLMFQKEENEEFSGILNYLRNKSPDQLKITSSSVCQSNVPQNVILFEDQKKYFWSINAPNNWICFDFCDHRVSPTDYTIKTSTNWSNPNPNPRNWVIEGSNDTGDNKSWTVLSEESNISILDGQGGITHTFNIQKKSSERFRFIQFRQTGTNGHGNNAFIFDSFEIYGLFL